MNIIPSFLLPNFLHNIPFLIINVSKALGFPNKFSLIFLIFGSSFCNSIKVSVDSLLFSSKSAVKSASISFSLLFLSSSFAFTDHTGISGIFLSSICVDFLSCLLSKSCSSTSSRCLKQGSPINLISISPIKMDSGSNLNNPLFIVSASSSTSM